MNNEILAAIQIMLIGMGVVVLFLIILVYVMKFVSVVVAQINKIMPPQEEAISSAPVQSASGDKMKAIAIALAHIHSNKK
ncbi:sodium pump decarboxylase [Brachyspira aalborgi]|uniref:Sodium pump decarboxylase n=1 Tax=Brachyspira aalborgi TaxID=29522 RepID=A0AB38PXE3_9SPIR|nr:OadG family transporter subunit [Brachyspira aalborgi]TXJ14990.1 sodium pump decarboxylase [Brachyspira aalborgi]TXJ18374.1 sodium pump decarboxylase [Brachyspira aalborgi]TXJ24330.1 sodium pump decarboxylase [Brachyspira aalborgi]TXJ51604.1 sodium pump decarboxylase [Brachyspira aalborgi]